MFRVLLIDDDEDDSILVREYLKEAYGDGGRLDWRATPEAGLEALRSQSYDVCLLDYRLNLANGLEVITSIVAVAPALPIIFLTGQGDRNVDLNAMRAGATDYFSKFDLDADLLDRKIRYAINRTELRSGRTKCSIDGGIRILLVEDDEDDYALVKEMLADTYGEAFSLKWVHAWDEALEEIRSRAFDVCLLDYYLEERNGLDLVREAVARGARTPLILLTGQGSREIDVEAMHAGASDYLDKNDLSASLLDRAIRYAMERHKAEQRAVERSLAEGPFIALIEDDEDDYLLTRDFLSDIYGTTFRLDWIQDWPTAIETIGESVHDVYLVDYRLGEGNGLDLIRSAVASGCTSPIILLTGDSSRETDIEAMKAGASDYLIKGEITAPLLDRAIRYSIERNRSEQRLTELAQYDQLTGLANRALFKDYLTAALARAERKGTMVAVMLVDLDRFKFVNDTHGHDAGDQLLKVAARRLKACVRASDLVARLGGDEFTVVLQDVEDATIVGHFGDRILETVKRPTMIGGNQVSTTASVGIAIYPIDVDNQEELIKSADIAMYRAKEQGSDNYQFYTVEMHIEAARRQEVERGLRSAIEREEFRLVFQPQLEVASGKVIGFEALLRWDHPESGTLGPNHFIDLAEETGLIVPIGEFVLRSAFNQARAFWESGLRDFRMAVNLSARQFQELDLNIQMHRILEECGVSPDLIEIEITESSILKDEERVRGVLKEFNDMGLLVALDDFGTGYSSLNHLKNFPGASIKIDRTFVRNVIEDPNDAAIVRAVIAMAHNLSLRVIAEGVETEEQLAFLRGEGCDAVQGYLLCRPTAPERLTPEYLASVSDIALGRGPSGYIQAAG